MKSPITLLALLVLPVMLIIGCATTPLVLSPNASDVRTGKADPSGNAKELGPVTGADGAGCGLYGSRGTYDRAYIRLKNTATALDANYVQIYSIAEPHLSGGCFVNVFTISGMAYKMSSTAETPRGSNVSTGTCFSVAPDGLILTAYHLVKDANTITARCENGDELPAVPEQVAANTDLALLRVNRPTPIYLTFPLLQNPKLGEPVFTLGFPAPSILGLNQNLQRELSAHCLDLETNRPFSRFLSQCNLATQADRS